LPTDTNFSTDWLEERRRFDAAARNASVEAACLQYAAQFQTLSLVDIGAGDGAVFSYLSPKLPPKQNWSLVELNPQLLQSARSRLLHWANGHGYTVEKEASDHLLFQRGERRLSVQLIKGSFLELQRLLPLEHYDLVTASAVFDLLSRPMLANLLESWQHNRLALYATLHYQSMEYFPGQAEDRPVIEAFERHMQRQQDFGRALGPDCCAALSELMEYYFRQAPIAGPSPWLIRPGDVAMHRHLFAFIENSLADFAPETEVESWIQSKEALLDSGQLRLQVEHCDHFIAPAYV